MSTTNSISGTSSANQPAAGISGTPANEQITQSQFLQLITAQLKDQNPLSPSDPNQFVSELEGMSEVSGMQGIQTALQSSSLTSGTNMIGRSVLASGSTATLSTGGSIGGAVNAPAGASNLSVSIKDANGNIVQTMSVTPADSGMTYFSWNGQTSSGTAAPAGTYTIGVNASVNGTTQGVDPMVVNKVDSVVLDSSSNSVDLETDAGNSVPLSSVVAIM